MQVVRRLVRNATCLVLMSTLSAMASGATYYVRPSGNDRAEGTSPATAFRTLLHAAQVLNHGDTVIVAPGVYREPVLIGERFGTASQPLSILGDETGRQTGDRPGEVVIEPATTDAPGLHVHRAAHVVLSGLTWRGSGEGLRLENCRTARIERCTFDGLAKGLSVSLCQDVRVESTVIKRCTIGMLASQSAETRLAHVTLVGSSSVGLFLLSCGPGTVRNSILVANNTSLVADPSSAMVWTSDYNAIHGTMGAWGLVPVTYNAHEWFAASGLERHSVYVPPDFAAPDQFDLRIAPQVTWGGGLPGQFVGRKLDPEVKLDRDGRPFTVRDGAVGAGAFDYPESVPGPGWKKLSIRLPADAPRQSAAVYRPDGTLLRMLVSDAAGIRDLWWDGRDDQGQPLPAGSYSIRGVTHDVRLLNDGHFGDNGNPLGTYNCDNADRVVVFPDGSFAVSTVYDEAGIPLRYHAASGQPLSGSALAEKDIWDLAAEGAGQALICGIEKKLVRVVPPGERTRMASGAENYPLLAGGERLALEADGKRERPPTGLAVLAGVAYVGLPGLDVVRGIDLKTGRKTVDWPLPAVADVQAGEQGTLWALSGTDVVQLTPPAGPGRRIPTKLATPRYLAAGSGRLAVIDRAAERIAIFDAASGQLLRTLGKDRPAGQWLPVSGDAYRGPRDAAFLPDGRLLLTEAGRIRALWPDSGAESFAVLSNFMDNAVPHPAKPEYVYCYGGNVFRIDPATGAWTWALEGPPTTTEIGLRQMSTRATLGGRHFILAHNDDRRPREAGKPLATYCLIDVTDPLRPRLSTLLPVELWAYSDLRFTREGHLVMPQSESLQFKLVPFQGLDAQQNPTFDFEHTSVVGPKTDAEPRAMSHKSGVTIDSASNDFYYLAVTAAHNKMVPFWGASATGIGRSRADGAPLWFSLSSGGNYTSISSVRDARDLWVFAGKDFGGQVDVFDTDGLRLTTSNWGWSSNWQSGFVDMRDGVQAYLRPDGKPGVWIEDDNIGRFNRCRLDGAETVRRTAVSLAWSPSGATAGPAPVADRTAGRSLQRPLVLPNIKKTLGGNVDGDWTKWDAAGIVPQLICLPIVAWGRTAPGDLMQTMRAGTAVGAFAHDGQHVYAYFLVADDSPHCDAPTGERMWMYDSLELWLEEEQIGLGFRQDGRPALFKYRFHDRVGKQYAAGYALPDGNIWGRVLSSLGDHPLSRYLVAATGKSFDGRPGYALMAKIPFEELKLVGGVAGRAGDKILPMTGHAGEIIRIGVAIDCISYGGREQDYKVYWPCGLMFSDPTRNVSFALGE